MAAVKLSKPDSPIGPRGPSLFTRIRNVFFPTPTVNILVAGRPNIGKTVSIFMLCKRLVNFHPPSGIQFSHPGVAALRDFADETIRCEQLLREGGSSARSLKFVPIDLDVRKGDSILARVRLIDTIGQSLVNVGKSATPEQRSQHEEFLNHADQADGMIAVIPCPSEDAGLNLLELDVPFLNHNFWEIIDRRSSRHPLVVAVGFAKTDARFHSRDKAMQELSDEVLSSALGPVVGTLSQAQRKVTGAAVFPYTNAGYGRTQILPTDLSALRAGNVAQRFNADEQIKVVDGDGRLEPDNLVEMFLWTVLTVLSKRAADTSSMREGFLGMYEDFQALEPWFMPISGPIRRPLNE